MKKSIKQSILETFMQKHGYYLNGTGGGLQAYQKDVVGVGTLHVTDGEADAPTDLEQSVLVTLLGEEDESLGERYYVLKDLLNLNAIDVAMSLSKGGQE